MEYVTLWEYIAKLFLEGGGGGEEGERGAQESYSINW